MIITGFAYDKSAEAGGIAAGVVFVDPEGRVLLLRRSMDEPNYGGHWALPGGKADLGEEAEDAARRECSEEMGSCPDGEMKPISRVSTPNGMTYHTFMQRGPAFAPKLNSEHTEHQWSAIADLPEPLHPSVEKMFKEHGKKFSGAMDKSVRTVGADGQLHVELANISKANICPYLGKEIPDFEALGLKPDQIYQFLRDPEELAKATATFNNLPLLSEHVPVTADDFPSEFVVGSTGTDAAFVEPFMTNSLVVWSGESIKAIESNKQKELSSAYRYRADMTAGSYKGERYDGVMRDIVGNHVALVKSGRAGGDVVVGDSNKEIAMLLTRKAAMTLGGLVGYLKPKLAADAKLDISTLIPGLKGLNNKNFKERQPKIIEGVKKLTVGKLAKDADLADLGKLLDAFGGEAVAEDPSTAKPMPGATDPNAAMPMKDPNDTDDDDSAMDDDVHGKVMEFLKGKLSDEDLAAVGQMIAAEATVGDEDLDDEATDEDPKLKELGAVDEPPEFKGKPKLDAKKPVAAKDKEPEKKDMVDKPAMDAAIKSAVKAVTDNSKAVRDAERAVRPYVGELAIACDSAEAVYRAAFEVLGVPSKLYKDVHPSAFPTILSLQKKPGERERRPVVAMDAATPTEDYAKRFPGAERIGIV